MTVVVDQLEVVPPDPASPAPPAGAAAPPPPGLTPAELERVLDRARERALRLEAN